MVNKKIFFTILKIILATIPIVWIFSKINASDLTTTLGNVSQWTIPSIIVIGLLIIFLQGLKWWMLLRSFLPNLSLCEVLSSHLKAMYYSITLPTSAAQDVVRTVLLSKNNDYSVLWGATWIARISGLLVLLVISFCGVFTIDHALLPKATTQVLFFILIALAVLIVLSFSKKSTALFRITFRKILPQKSLVVIENIRDGIYFYRHKKLDLFLTIPITIIIQFLFIFNAILIIKGITGNFYIYECMAFIPLIEIICISLPLTPNGIGIRDALTAVMFRQLNLSNEQLASYIILGFIAILLKLVGIIPITWEMFVKKTQGNRLHPEKKPARTTNHL